MTGPTDVVEQLVDRWLSGDLEGAQPMLAPKCTFRPLRSDRTYQGLEALYEFLGGLSAEDQEAKVTPQSFLGRGDNVVMLGTVAFPRTLGERSYTEHQSLGWVFTVRAGQVVEVATYTSWDAATEAAGLSNEAKPDVERSRGEARPLFMRRLRLRRGTV